ncbi:hypothetical protein PHMEG_00014067 [Phytophthora megakarya]|uniref:Uncharacterized protein n=1 Tax=Phytophthora megakarya TaxID=4795 RepID=A0A225W576_9STRA|nr:hypothetical protein PHMEG_00014067 [Phytophthora megakarya]
MKKYQQAGATCKEIISRLERNEADSDYSIRPALGFCVIVLEALRQNMVKMYHDYLRHPGCENQYHSMSTFWRSGMEETVTQHVKVCFERKKTKFHGGRQHYGDLPPHLHPTPIVYLMWCTLT